MSNCIMVDDGELNFTSDQIDVEKFRETLGAHAGCSGHFGESHGGKGFDALTCSTVYWFLCPDRNVRFTPRGVEVSLGRGRSTHTNRDLAQTLGVIAAHLRRPVQFSILIRDEFDGFREQVRCSYALGPGEVPRKQGI